MFDRFEEISMQDYSSNCIFASGDFGDDGIEVNVWFNQDDGDIKEITYDSEPVSFQYLKSMFGNKIEIFIDNLSDQAY